VIGEPLSIEAVHYI